MENKFTFYLHSDHFQIDNFSTTNFESFRKHAISLIDVASHLKAEIYYSEEDISEIKDDIDTFDGYIQSSENFLDILLAASIPNKNKIHYFEVVYNREQSSLQFFQLKSLHPTCINKEKTNIVLSLGSNVKKNLLLINSKEDFHKVNINFFSSARDIWSFINENSPSRKYNFSTKHGNSINLAVSPKANEKPSQLNCTDEEAQVLLNSAIFDLRERMWCYNFDEKVETYIIFPFEGFTPQNQFHAYHIEKSEWDKEIPESIRKYFGK